MCPRVENFLLELLYAHIIVQVQLTRISAALYYPEELFPDKLLAFQL